MQLLQSQIFQITHTFLKGFNYFYAIPTTFSKSYRNTSTEVPVMYVLICWIISEIFAINMCGYICICAWICTLCIYHTNTECQIYLWIQVWYQDSGFAGIYLLSTRKQHKWLCLFSWQKMQPQQVQLEATMVGMVVCRERDIKEKTVLVSSSQFPVWGTIMLYFLLQWAFT